MLKIASCDRRLVVLSAESGLRAWAVLVLKQLELPKSLHFISGGVTHGLAIYHL
jgi:hypothetical protein